MKAIVLCAGQGKRLLPLTERAPKCLLRVGDRSILEWQLRGLSAAGITEATLVTGFEAAAIEAALPGITPPGLRVRTRFNPFFAVAENIGSCFLVRDLLQAGEMVLLNGDTLFEPAVLRHLLAAPDAPITVTIDRKPGYDADDMKVSVEGTRLRAIGKTLSPEETNGESIGMLRFQDGGGALFAAGLEAALRQPEGLRRWYLSVIHALAGTGDIRVTSIEGLSWGEVDYPNDLEQAEALVRSWAAPAPAMTGAG
ncbi:NTP transferase domain-containing protein [Pararoseomonas indoligenes]|uniref:Phosphocholine cytidylyltransferase family protein n=1 Tax=Roseomonas indoligenes TaxID=2820811 RepID=A0A940MPR2_9PROT|nr:phosphocholine cytidylyltransferase family protein [Pararoseomonas indoligenes]MBP0491239.1 phosphocholine cytidylyltransferase family protein [Pararoseomonas indoligenes]